MTPSIALHNENVIEDGTILCGLLSPNVDGACGRMEATMASTTRFLYLHRVACHMSTLVIVLKSLCAGSSSHTWSKQHVQVACQDLVLQENFPSCSFASLYDVSSVSKCCWNMNQRSAGEVEQRGRRSYWLILSVSRTQK